MKSIRRYLIFLLLALLAGCGGGGGGGGGSSAPQVTLLSIDVTPASPIMTAGETVLFSATGHYSDGTTATNLQVTWSTNAPSNVVTIGSSSGIAVAASTIASTATYEVTATLGGIAKSISLMVSPVTLTSIVVTPANQSINVGDPLQFLATGIFSDNSRNDLTSHVTWSSSGSVIESISSAGLATGTVAGTSTITATADGKSGSTSLTVTAAASTANDNQLQVTVNGSRCSAATSASYPNKPCVSVTICDPNTAACQEISDILLDTGSFGLRIFKQALTTPLQNLPHVTNSSGSLAECVQFADFSTIWGPVMLANVKLAGEPAVQVPIQIIDASFGSIPSNSHCTSPDAQPTDAGYTGILGVGHSAEDHGLYYACNGSSCGGTITTVVSTSQVVNPVARLPLDNNGVVVKLPAVSLGGAGSVDGLLVLGIDTQTNNSSSGVTKYPTNSGGGFLTNFNGSTVSSFTDTGSNGLFFSGGSLLTVCASPNDSWFCQSPTKELTATNSGLSSTPSGLVRFNIGNFATLLNQSNHVFAELGGPSPGFDWGLPFFLGRNVFVGIVGRPSTNLGLGPYTAY